MTNTKNDPANISFTDGGMVVETDGEREHTIGSWYMTAGMFAANLDDGNRVGPYDGKEKLARVISEQREKRQQGQAARGFTSAAATPPSELTGEERDEALQRQRAAEAGEVRPDGHPDRPAAPSTAEVENRAAEAERAAETKTATKTSKTSKSAKSSKKEG